MNKAQFKDFLVERMLERKVSDFDDVWKPIRDMALDDQVALITALNTQDAKKISGILLRVVTGPRKAKVRADVDALLAGTSVDISDLLKYL